MSNPLLAEEHTTLNQNRMLPYWLRVLRAYCHFSPMQRGKFRLVENAYRRMKVPAVSAFSNLDSVGNVELKLHIWVDFNIYCIGLYEHYLARYFVSQLKPQAVVLDIGAYIGQYALLAAHYAPQGFAYAFEPVRASAARIRESIRRIGIQNCEVIQQAVGDTRGTASIFPAAQPFLSSRYPEHAGTNLHVEVPQTTIDLFCADRGIDHVDAVKIDVEEAEDSVLSGATKTIARDRPLVFLEVGKVTHLSMPSPALAILKSLGYSLFRINHGRLEPITGLVEAAENVIAIAR